MFPISAQNLESVPRALLRGLRIYDKKGTLIKRSQSMKRSSMRYIAIFLVVCLTIVSNGANSGAGLAKPIHEMLKPAIQDLDFVQEQRGTSYKPNIFASILGLSTSAVVLAMHTVLRENFGARWVKVLIGGVHYKVRLDLDPTEQMLAIEDSSLDFLWPSIEDCLAKPWPQYAGVAMMLPRWQETLNKIISRVISSILYKRLFVEGESFDSPAMQEISIFSPSQVIFTNQVHPALLAKAKNASAFGKSIADLRSNGAREVVAFAKGLMVFAVHTAGDYARESNRESLVNLFKDATKWQRRSSSKVDELYLPAVQIYSNLTEALLSQRILDLKDDLYQRVLSFREILREAGSQKSIYVDKGPALKKQKRQSKRNDAGSAKEKEQPNQSKNPENDLEVLKKLTSELDALNSEMMLVQKWAKEARKHLNNEDIKKKQQGLELCRKVAASLQAFQSKVGDKLEDKVFKDIPALQTAKDNLKRLQDYEVNCLAPKIEATLTDVEKHLIQLVAEVWERPYLYPLRREEIEEVWNFLATGENMLFAITQEAQQAYDSMAKLVELADLVQARADFMLKKIAEEQVGYSGFFSASLNRRGLFPKHWKNSLDNKALLVFCLQKIYPYWTLWQAKTALGDNWFQALTWTLEDLVIPLGITSKKSYTTFWDNLDNNLRILHRSLLNEMLLVNQKCREEYCEQFDWRRGMKFVGGWLTTIYGSSVTLVSFGKADILGNQPDDDIDIAYNKLMAEIAENDIASNVQLLELSKLLLEYTEDHPTRLFQLTGTNKSDFDFSVYSNIITMYLRHKYKFGQNLDPNAKENGLVLRDGVILMYNPFVLMLHQLYPLLDPEDQKIFKPLLDFLNKSSGVFGRSIELHFSIDNRKFSPFYDFPNGIDVKRRLLPSSKLSILSEITKMCGG